MAAGLALAALGFALMAQATADSGFALVVGGSVAFSLGLAQVFTLATDLMVGSAPPERAGAASGISETSSELGGALGIAILGTLATAVYRAHLDDAIPAGVPPGEAEAARDTFAGAVTASERLEEPIAGELLAGAHDAFAQGFQLAATVSMAVAIVAAAVAAVLLRRVGVDGASPPPPAAGGSLTARPVTGCLDPAAEL